MGVHACGLKTKTAVPDCNTRNRTGPGHVDPEADSTVSVILYASTVY